MKGDLKMDKKAQVEQLTTYMANFVSYIGKVLPDDIKAKIDELAEKEDSPLSKVIYQTMQKNQVLAKELNRPASITLLSGIVGSVEPIPLPLSDRPRSSDRQPAENRTATMKANAEISVKMRFIGYRLC